MRAGDFKAVTVEQRGLVPRAPITGEREPASCLCWPGTHVLRLNLASGPRLPYVLTCTMWGLNGAWIVPLSDLWRKKRRGESAPSWAGLTAAPGGSVSVCTATARSLPCTSAGSQFPSACTPLICTSVCFFLSVDTARLVLGPWWPLLYTEIVSRPSSQHLLPSTAEPQGSPLCPF